MHPLEPFVPIDRLRALAHGVPLPDRTQGAALFADITGFTPLTHALVVNHGYRTGAEKLTRQLNTVYEALVNVVHRFGGSVIGFSGDAITCWFDGDDGWLATTCALDMQNVMKPFASSSTDVGVNEPLTIKIAIAAGPARRFLVGDPEIQGSGNI
jgi:class 3 adenylate cyclase